jgi:DNA (cytosine-5)-methyltransferase 1
MRAGKEGGGKGALVQMEKSGALATANDQTLIYENHAQDARYTEKKTCPTVTSRYGTGGNNVPLTIQKRSCVRKLTPVECERLQGFPDNYTRIPYRGKPESECPDGPRYKAIGNSWAVPVVRWIGKRINKALGR